MDNNGPVNTADEKIICFDKSSSSSHTQMLKVLLPHIPGAFQKYLSVLIKFLELQYMMHHPFSYPSSTSYEGDVSIIINELTPFCTARERTQFESVINMLKRFEQMKNMMEMLQMINEMKEMFGGDGDGLSPDILAGMMGMNPQDMNGFNPDMLAAMMNMGKEFL